jgi:hypothetical protein
MPLDPTAASVHPMVTIPFALATAQRTTPRRLALQPSHLLPSAAGQPRDGPFRFHPAEPRPATGAIGASTPRRLCPANGPVTIRDSASTATDPSRLPSRCGFAPRRDQSPSPIQPAPRRTHSGRHQAGPRIVTTRVTERRRVDATIPLDPNAASVHPMVTIPLAAATDCLPHRRGSHCDRAVSFHQYTRPRRDGLFCIHAAERCLATGAIGASIPPRLCPAIGPATIGDPACPATGHLVSITPSVAPRPSHLVCKQG